MGSGPGQAEGPQRGHWLTQSHPLSDELSKASGHSFTQQTFIEIQDKGSSVQGLWFSLKSSWEDGEGLINGGRKGLPGPESRPPAKARLSGPGPANPPGNLKNSGGIHHL